MWPPRPPPTPFSCGLALLLLATGASAQELVVNGGFEAFSRCPTGPGLVDTYCDDWRRTSTASTDYQNTCGFSAHAPRTGQAHVGLLAYDFSANYREYATGELTAPLQGGVTYRFETWLILDPGRLHAVSEVGAYFSASPPTFTGTGPLAVVPQVLNAAGPLADKVDWMQVAGTFVAAGGESFVTIGNFFDDVNTTKLDFGCCGQFGAYYHVDDVSLVAVRDAPIDVSCAIVADRCPLNPALDRDGQLDFAELVDVEITLHNPTGVDVTGYAALLEVSGAVLVDPPSGDLAVPIIPGTESRTVLATLRLASTGGAVVCGDPVDLALRAQGSDQGLYPDADLVGCDFLMGDPSGSCAECLVPPPCLWRADASRLDPLTPPASALFMPPTPAGLSLQGLPWQCPMADGDLERDPAALANGIPATFYQVDVATESLRLEKAGTTIRFRF